MEELGGFLFLLAIGAGLWLAWRNLRAALSNPKSAPATRATLLGLALAWMLGGGG